MFLSSPFPSFFVLKIVLHLHPIVNKYFIGTDETK